MWHHIKKSKKYFLITFFITCSFMFIIKINILEIFHNTDKTRKLYTELSSEYSCDKAGSRLIDKYAGDFDEEAGETKRSLNDAEKSIVDIIRDSKYSNVKSYFKRVGIYIAFLCLAVIFIIFWITYCSCSCCNCCLFSTIEKAHKTLQTTFYLIGAITSLIVIAFSIVVLCLIDPFFSRLNGLSCSILLLLDHLNYGLSPQYPPRMNQWVGLGGVSSKFNESGNAINSINKEYIDNLYNESTNICKETDNDCICNDTDIDEDYEFFSDFHLLLKSLHFSNKSLSFLNSKRIIDDSRIDANDDIYNFLHDYANSHIKRACFAIFIITLCLGVFGLLFLGMYYFMKKEIYRIIYIVIWNLSMLISIIAIIVSAIYGVIGYVFTDFVQVIHYTLSYENLLSFDPILFKHRQTTLADIIHECANDNGHILDTVVEDIMVINQIMIFAFELEIEKVNETSCNEDAKNKIIEFYESIKNGTDILFTSIMNLFNISCAFAKNDKNIILNEISSAGKRATVISTFQFLIGVLLGISILAGILLVHKYNYGKNNTLKVIEVSIEQNSNKSFEQINSENKK